MNRIRRNFEIPPELRTRGNADRAIMRSVVDLFGIWETCHKACRRRKACASPTIACFDVNCETLREQLEALAAWPRLDGPREESDLGQPVGELFD
jgi:hypothetical protein